MREPMTWLSARTVFTPAVRMALWGQDHPKYTGMVSYRGVFPRTMASDLRDMDAFTKWWGECPEKQIVVFPLTGGKEIFVFATLPQSEWSEEGWTLPGNVEDLRTAYANFHPEARKILDCVSEVTRSALHVRDPMPQWAKGHVTLLGDAAHPMVPFMAQGACMAIEDAVVLARALNGRRPRRRRRPRWTATRTSASRVPASYRKALWPTNGSRKAPMPTGSMAMMLGIPR